MPEFRMTCAAHLKYHEQVTANLIFIKPLMAANGHYLAGGLMKIRNEVGLDLILAGTCRVGRRRLSPCRNIIIGD